jgi:hypothetical protein
MLSDSALIVRGALIFRQMRGNRGIFGYDLIATTLRSSESSKPITSRKNDAHDLRRTAPGTCAPRPLDAIFHHPFVDRYFRIIDPCVAHVSPIAGILVDAIVLDVPWTRDMIM